MTVEAAGFTSLVKALAAKFLGSVLRIHMVEGEKKKKKKKLL
jgi:NAD/NADP transhydrogenase alpha subunit